MYILDGLLKNLSDIQPNTLYADTQGQSVPVFAISYLLGIKITAVTNIVEKYHDFLDWVCFGKDGTITENDPIEQEKRFKYLDLVASAVILHNTVDVSLAIQTLMARGEPVHQRYIKALSPFITRHIKRYRDYVVNLHMFPQPLEAAINLPPEIFEI